MDEVVPNAHMFWEIVETTLVELYRMERGLAGEKIAARRGKMTRPAIVRNLVYHSQPIHVAHEIAAPLEPLTDEMLSRYDAVFARVQARFGKAAQHDAPLDTRPGQRTPAAELAFAAAR